MAEAVEDIPPPPPGFTVNAAPPPPPPGFTITGGGAAVGNPNLARQGDRAIKDVSIGERGLTIGGAGAMGSTLGAAAPELLSMGAAATRAFPQLAPLSTGLDFASQAARAAGRIPGAIAGGMAGLGSETAGQVVEGAGGPQIAAEGARLVAGGPIGEIPNAAKEVLKKYAVVPALGLMSKFKHETAKKFLSMVDGTPQSLSQKERDFVDSVISEVRGGEKTDAPLEAVGSIMGAEGQRLLSASEAQTVQALRQAGNVGNPGGYPGTTQEMADIGGGLRKTITTRNEALLKARGDEYNANQRARDALVSGRESSGNYPSQLPEYESVINEIKSQLSNTDAMNRSPAVAANYKFLLSQLTNGEKDVFGQAKPVSFQALDDVRRQLGDAFRGKPSEGYAAMDTATAKDFYHKISAVQKKYAGGDTGPQAKLLDDYASATPGLEKFSSTFGKKATALDQYRDEQFATDASSLPSTFFKTRASIQALHELTGNKTQVQAAALEYANKELAGKDGGKVRDWMSKNSEWLSEVPTTRTLIDKYATRLEGSERSMRNATDFAAKAEKNADMLIGKGLPAQQAVDLIKSGNAEFWAKVIPVIQKSPQAKDQMVLAVRQVVADQAASKSTGDLFSRNIRPFLERSGIATTAEMESVAKGLADIQAKKIPEGEKLGLGKRLILQSIGGYTAGGASRSAVGGYGLLADQIPQ